VGVDDICPLGDGEGAAGTAEVISGDAPNVGNTGDVTATDGWVLAARPHIDTRTLICMVSALLQWSKNNRLYCSRHRKAYKRERLAGGRARLKHPQRMGTRLHRHGSRDKTFEPFQV
jgi:hypothetical protein